MSGKSKNRTLGNLLAKRGLGVASVAKLIFSGQPHLSQVLRGQRKGTVTWNKLVRVLNKEEMECALEYANQRLADDGVVLSLGKDGTKVTAQATKPSTSAAALAKKRGSRVACST